MKSRLLSVFILLFTLIAGIGGEALASPPSPEGQGWPAVTNLDDGLMLEWQIPFPSFVPQPDESVLVQLSGFDSDRAPGLAELPYTSRIIALPPGASPEISVVDEVSSEMTLAEPLTVAPPAEHTRPDGTPLDQTASATPQQPVLHTVAFKDLGDLRGVRLAQITIHPVLAQGNTLKIVSQLKVEVKFNAAPVKMSAASKPVLDELAGMVLNPQNIASASEPATVSPQMAQAQTPAAAIQITSEGMYRVTGASLSAKNFPIASVDPHKLHLTRAGADIPFEWEGNDDNTFQSNEALVFYAQPRFSRWANYDVYFLSATNNPRQQLSSLDASITSETAGASIFEKAFEQNNYYTPDCLCAPIPMGRDGDRWVWDQSGIARDYQPSATRSFTFAMSNVSSSQSAVLNVWLIGNTDVDNINPDHNFRVSVNGTSVGQPMVWDGKQAVQGTFTIPAGVLQNSNTNTLTFTLPGIAGVNIEGAWLDAFSIKYQPGSTALDGEAYFTGSGGSGKYYQVNLNGVAGLQIFEVTNPDAPVLLISPGINGNTVSFADKNNGAQPRFAVVTGTKIKTPADIRMAKPLLTQSTARADFVIISPNSLDTTPNSAFTALSGLVSLRQSQGLATVIEDVQAIFDAYGGGIPVPDAIHAYLQDIYTNWNPKPSYVLLVGDGTIDPKKYQSNSFTTFIPPYLADFDAYATEGATDNRFVTFGGPTDIIPDMGIGRLPVQTQAELTSEVNKIVNYEAHPAAGSWKNNATLVTAMPDGGGNFTSSGYDEATQLQCTVPLGKLFYPVPYTTVASVHDTLISRWNSGTGFIVFNGHASIQQWATREQGTNNFKDFFHFNEIAGLTNGLKLPVVLDMTCFTGAYQTPGLRTVDEGLALAGNGGALAAWGSTGMGLTSAHEYLAQGFIATIVKQSGARLGDAAIQGKLNLLAKNPANSDLVDSFNLLGDPTSILSFNDVQSCMFVPSVRR